VSNEPPVTQGARFGRIPVRVPTRVGGLTSLRSVARSMVESEVWAVVVEDPVGPSGLVSARDVIEAIAAGADPDIVWAGEIMRPGPRIVSCKQHPAEVGEEMAAYELDIVAVVDENAPVGLTTALDVLGAVIRTARESATESESPES
jgi:CBS domain-containing protein